MTPLGIATAKKLSAILDSPTGASTPAFLTLLELASNSLQDSRAAILRSQSGYTATQALHNPHKPIMAIDDPQVKRLAASLMLEYAYSGLGAHLSRAGISLSPEQLGAAKDLWAIIEAKTVEQAKGAGTRAVHQINGNLQAIG